MREKKTNFIFSLPVTLTDLRQTKTEMIKALHRMIWA